MSAPGGESFPVTRLSVVAAARSSDAAERSLALETLFAAYWKPIYKYLRLKYAQAPPDAQDLTQGFFAELLERGLLAKFDPAKSRLRTYLRLCADSFALNEIKAASRKKRGDVKSTTNTLSVESLDASISAVGKAGGTLIMPRTPIPGVGYFAYCVDPEGNLFGMMQADVNAK
ncbi:MAG TPA: sigma factor [Candidatus Acidoferrum sp.]|nr:sigma factor [Candidatus Acidoferrum sp.]